MLFEWDERKRLANLAKHHIDFQDVMRVFDGPVFETVDSRQGEERVVGQRRRIISARRAHRNERQDYANHLKIAHRGKN